MANIYFIRHGQASFGSDNYDNLSPLGHSQAQHLAKHFNQRNIRPDQVICGDMARHLQTRDACLASLSAPLMHNGLQITPAWNEFDHEQVISVYRPDLASPEALQHYLKQQPSPAKAFITLFSQAISQWQDSENTAQYHESWEHFSQRVTQGLSQLIQQADKEETIFVFTSGGVISKIIMQTLAIPENKFFDINRQLVNASVTQLQLKSQHLNLITMNEHGFFDGDYRHLYSLL
ncbi:histidine phosphatase family protein [Shewanella phaeophyticola]|uniref:Histidine phosphatase family protein n=1 Tax=Shewanella phaeophyticola TaxID=2978345 RepID=A0ABT2P277_9GAMM|nr:histidine phosphatase family protein [Shewanella sp. KJ10-1]MCT8986738.1 histidine phosphatase family protein [Shewanella sp. KJ10-1]